jgi:hypothetical protein
MGKVKERNYLIEVTLVRVKDPTRQYPLEEDMELKKADISARHIFSVITAQEGHRFPLVNCMIGTPIGELLVAETRERVRTMIAEALAED